MKKQTITETDDRRDRAFLSSAFTDVIFARGSKRKPAKPAPGEILIRVRAAGVTPSQKLCITGSCEALGCWDTRLAQELSDAEYPVWDIALSASSLPAVFEYKFIVTDRATGSLLAWEEGCNRRFDYFRTENQALILNAAPFDNPLKWRGAGTAIPLFALRSAKSFGTGDFSDLKLMVDWAARTGQNVIQLLPVNDTTSDGSWRDSYPYNANSIFALHPQYIDLRSVGKLKNRSEQRRLEALAAELNALPAVDYERVNALKHEYLRQIYAEQGEKTLASAPYAAFFRKNAEWLVPYAAYCTERDGSGDAEYWYFVQYHLDRQLRSVRNYAHSKGVILKGDIPIGINPTGVDARTNPELFNLDASAGAPPDDFAVQGQNWGFPTYRWDRMAEDGYSWWRARFVKMSDFFDAYRIDHILGFFRIWEIPHSAVNALVGHFNPALPMDTEEIRSCGFDFDPALHTAPVNKTDNVLFVEDPVRKGLYHPRIAAQNTEIYKSLSPHQQNNYNRLYDNFFFNRHNELWHNEAVRKLVPLISSTGMLVCGEDLGMIPACVPDVMRELQILSLEIERMPKKYGSEFGNPAEYPYLSVASPSTHDMANLRLWWNEDKERRNRYYNNILRLEGTAPDDCTAEICESLVRRELNAASMLAILPLQDWLSISSELRRENPAEERINDPSNPDQNWNYRMHITLEDLLAADDFNSRLRDLIKSAGR